MCGRQRQRRRRRQLGPDIAQLAVEAVLVRRATGPGRRRPAAVRAEPGAGRRARRRRDHAAVRAEVGRRTSSSRRQQAGVGDVNDVAV